MGTQVYRGESFAVDWKRMVAAKTLITEAEYLGMSFDGREPDYVDGEVVERARPNTQHSIVQANFVELVLPWKVQRRLFALPELRIRTTRENHRIVDVAVYRDRRPADPIPTETPTITLEIVSPDDRHEELMTKLAEYRGIGVANVWKADPGLRTLSVFDRGSLLQVEAFELPEFELRFTPEQLFDA